jgi:hypothetical protein
MTEQLLSAFVLLAAGASLIFIGWPSRSGDNPRFLQFEAAMMLYPPIVLALIVAGVVQLLLAIS